MMGRKASKPLCTESYSNNAGFVDRSDMMANNYSISQKTWKWTKKTNYST
jgi:hypothetical protein